jgi:hypothetical protein
MVRPFCISHRGGRGQDFDRSVSVREPVLGQRVERLSCRQRTRHREVTDEGDCGGGSGCGKEWEHFRQFRVIVVQRNDHRRQHLLRALEASFAHRMFWLTIEALYKQNMGEGIFLTPRDHETTVHSFHSAFL